MNKMTTNAKLKIASALGAIGTLATAIATHAQVTFSATAPQAALTNSIDGSLDFFWDNAPAVVLIVAAIGIVLALAGLLLRKLGAKKKIGSAG